MSRKQKHLLLIGGKDSSVSELAKLGIRTTLFQTQEALTALQKKNCDQIHTIDNMGRAQLLSLAKAIHDFDPFDAVVSFYEPRLLDAAIIGEALAIRCNPLQAVFNSRDKLAFRKLLEPTELGNLAFQECSSLDNLEQVLSDVTLPCIIKPITGAGSSGVYLIKNKQDIALAKQHLANLPSWAQLDGSGFVVEEYVTGQEFSVESFTDNGRHTVVNITQKVTSGQPHFIELQHITPPLVSQQTMQALEKNTLLLLDTIGQQFGPAHSEFKVTQHGIYVIETQTRFGGDQIWEMSLLTQGIHFAVATICSLLDIECPSYPIQYAAAGIRFIHFDNQAIIHSLNSLEQPNVIRIEHAYQPGERAVKTIDSATRGGYVLVGSDNSKALINTLQNIENADFYEVAS